MPNQRTVLLACLILTLMLGNIGIQAQDDWELVNTVAILVVDEFGFVAHEPDPEQTFDPDNPPKIQSYANCYRPRLWDRRSAAAIFPACVLDGSS